MSFNRLAVSGVIWTTGTYAISVLVRFGSNVVLSRLLNPQLLGMLLIVNTVRQGIDLSSDVGFAQNVISNRNGDQPRFFNTVWVMQMVRGLILGVVLFIFATPFGLLYGLPQTAFQISGATLFVMGLASTSIFILHRNLALAKLNLFDLANDLIGAIIVVAAAVISPTLESLLFSVLVAQVIRSLLSYFISDHINSFMFSKDVAVQVVTFGRWIFLSSILAFLCTSFDRLYLAKTVPLAILGIYGLARALSDLPTMLAARIGYSVVFPLVSSSAKTGEQALRAQLSPMRRNLLAVISVAMAGGISISDLVVTFIYDSRYHEATWMLTLLLLGGWLSILCSLSEYSLLGVGKPTYNVVGNGLKLVFYVTVLPLAFEKLALFGAIVAIAFSDIARYVVLNIGQRREHISFLRQDLAATLFFVLLIGIFSAVRYGLGLGTAFDNVPIEKLSELFGGSV